MSLDSSRSKELFTSTEIPIQTGIINSLDITIHTDMIINYLKWKHKFDDIWLLIWFLIRNMIHHDPIPVLTNDQPARISSAASGLAQKHNKW